MGDNEIQDVYTSIYSCAVSVVKAELSELNDAYDELIGNPIPFKKFGFNSLESFINTVPKLKVTRSRNDIIIEPISTLNTAHIVKMVNQQKKDKKKKNRKPKIRAQVSEKRVNYYGSNSQKNITHYYDQDYSDEELQNVYNILFAFVFSTKEQRCTTDELIDYYADFTGHEIPFREFGFHNIYKFIKSVPILQVVHMNDDFFVLPVITAEIAYSLNVEWEPKNRRNNRSRNRTNRVDKWNAYDGYDVKPVSTGQFYDKYDQRMYSHNDGYTMAAEHDLKITVRSRNQRQVSLK